MQPQRKLLSWGRVAVLIWASLWMLAAPLFHVHPEADHRHGEVGHVHGGTVHLVWSPDLDCEFDSHRQVDRTEQSAQGHVGTPPAFSHLGDNHAEFSLALLSDSTDRKSSKQFFGQVLGLSPNVVSDVERNARIRQNITAVSSSVPFLHTISSRGPPTLLT